MVSLADLGGDNLHKYYRFATVRLFLSSRRRKSLGRGDAFGTTL